MRCASLAPSDRRPSVRRVWRCVVAPITFVVRFIAPEPIGCPPDPPRANLDCLLGLCLYASLCVMLARLIPETAPHADQVFWLSLSLLFSDLHPYRRAAGGPERADLAPAVLGRGYLRAEDARRSVRPCAVR